MGSRIIKDKQEKKNFRNFMSEIQGKIEIKKKQIQVEKDSTRKAEYQNQLQKLLIKKQIEDLKKRLDLFSAT